MENKRGRPAKYLVEEIKSMHDDIIEIKTTLKGYNGDVGLCDRVEANTKALNKVWIIIGIIAASSGATGFEVVRRLLGG